jgi:outer membrane protein assembly factor BamB
MRVGDWVIGIGNQVFISAAYGTFADLLEVNGSEYKKVWSNDDSMSNHYSTCVYRDGYLYGFHGRQEEGQALRCIQFQLRTGKVMWEVAGYGAGEPARSHLQKRVERTRRMAEAICSG